MTRCCCCWWWCLILHPSTHLLSIYSPWFRVLGMARDKGRVCEGVAEGVSIYHNNIGDSFPSSLGWCESGKSVWFNTRLIWICEFNSNPNIMILHVMYRRDVDESGWRKGCFTTIESNPQEILSRLYMETEQEWLGFYQKASLSSVIPPTTEFKSFRVVFLYLYSNRKYRIVNSYSRIDCYSAIELLKMNRFLIDFTLSC